MDQPWHDVWTPGPPDPRTPLGREFGSRSRVIALNRIVPEVNPDRVSLNRFPPELNRSHAAPGNPTQMGGISPRSRSMTVPHPRSRDVSNGSYQNTTRTRPWRACSLDLVQSSNTSVAVKKLHMLQVEFKVLNLYLERFCNLTVVFAAFCSCVVVHS